MPLPASTYPHRWDKHSKPHSYLTPWPGQNSPPTPITKPKPNPKPLSNQIDPWLWTSLILSLTSLLFLRSMNMNMNNDHILAYASGTHIQTHIVEHNDAGHSGDTLLVGLGVRLGVGLGFEALLAVIIFYNTMLLILSSKERQISAATTPGPLARVAAVEAGAEYKSSVIEDPEDVADADEGIVGDEEQRSAVIWILAVSQSGLAAVGLYVVARLVLVFGGFGETKAGHPVVDCFELVYALGEMGMMVYIAVCCLVQASARYSSGLRRSGET